MSKQHWMSHALTLAHQAESAGEVPVGAIVVYENEIIGSGYNQSISLKDPTAHAEIIAIRNACKNIGNYRLNNASLYVSLEPCIMCAGAMVHARIKNLYFGAYEPKAGAVVSTCNMLDMHTVNHRVEWEGNIMGKECGELLTMFFGKKRKGAKTQRRKEIQVI